MTTRIASALLVAALVPATTGCIAAVVPLAAGAAMVKTQNGRDDAPTRAAVPADAAAVAGSAARGTLTAIATNGDARVELTSLTSLPPPDAPTPANGATISAFRTYSLQVTDPSARAQGRPSAILAGASDLRVARGRCAPEADAVFIDLDPGRATFDPLAPGRADPALGEVLTILRERGLAVVWFSRLGAGFAAPARAALIASGLDTQGRDEVVLMRDLNERKQSLRDDVATRYCPVAMLGDERADFDELYLYLKDPNGALALDTMIGKGWFIASPFAPADPAQGATP